MHQMLIPPAFSYFPWVKTLCTSLLFAALACHGLRAQSLTTSYIGPLPAVADETSGLALLDGDLLTHNDSGNPPELYLIDPSNGALLRTINVGNAANNDWEDLATDSSYLYIGDFGNNYGTRQNLAILRIPLDSLRNRNTVMAEQIDFAYADQSSFGSNFFTNYDAEALVAGPQQLYLFTKNRGNLRSNFYPIPKLPGSYSAIKTDSINSQGLITAACASADGQQLYMLGADLSGPFLLRTDMGNLPAPFFNPSSTLRWDLAVQAAVQMEGIVHDGQYLWITTESQSGQPPGLYRVNTASLAVEDAAVHGVQLIPNPSAERMRVEGLGSGVHTFEVWDMQRRLVRKGSWLEKGELDLRGLPSGGYVLRIQGERSSQHMIFKN